MHAHATTPETAADPAGLAGQVASAVQHAEVTPDSLTRLTSGSHLSAAEAASYARMITEAAIRRDLPAHAGRIAETGNSDLAAHLLAATAAARTVIEAAPQEPALSHEQEARELTVLAGLLHDPGQISAVASWLPPESFADGIRREIYQAMASLDSYGDPVTSWTVTWQLAERRDPEVAGTRAWDDVSLYIQMHLYPPFPGPFDTVTAARDLLTGHIAAELNQEAQGTGQAPVAPAPHRQPLLEPPPPLPQTDPAIEPKL
jgi:hypothetical protein